jgi:nucleoprotein TPR
LEAARQQVSGTQSDASQTQDQLTTLRQELEAANSARDEALARAESSGQTNADVEMGEEGQINEGNSDASNGEIERLKAQLTEATNKENVASNQAASLHVQLTMIKDKVSELEKKEVSCYSFFLKAPLLTSTGGTHDPHCRAWR